MSRHRIDHGAIKYRLPVFVADWRKACTRCANSSATTLTHKRHGGTSHFCQAASEVMPCSLSRSLAGECGVSASRFVARSRAEVVA